MQAYFRLNQPMNFKNRCFLYTKFLGNIFLRILPLKCNRKDREYLDANAVFVLNKFQIPYGVFIFGFAVIVVVEFNC